jgi:hypothetical protein
MVPRIYEERWSGVRPNHHHRLYRAYPPGGIHYLWLLLALTTLLDPSGPKI